MTIPKDVRKLEHIHAGDELVVESRGGEIGVRKANALSRDKILEKSFGILGGGERGLVTVRRLRREWSKRAKRLGI